MPIDFKFVELMFTKYSKHLQDVVESIESMIGNYDKQISELQRAGSRYSNRIKELENKKTEAFKKLGDICPNIEKMTEMLNEIQSMLPRITDE